MTHNILFIVGWFALAFGVYGAICAIHNFVWYKRGYYYSSRWRHVYYTVVYLIFLAIGVVCFICLIKK